MAIIRSFSDLLVAQGAGTQKHVKDDTQSQIDAIKSNAAKNQRRLKALTYEIKVERNPDKRQELSQAIAACHKRLDNLVAVMLRLQDKSQAGFNSSLATSRKLPRKAKGKIIAAIAENGAIPVISQPAKPHLERVGAMPIGKPFAELNAIGQWHVIQNGKVIAGPFASEALADQWIEARKAKAFANIKRERDMSAINGRIEDALKAK